MHISQKIMLSLLLCSGLSEQLHAWYPGQNIVHFVAWLTQKEPAVNCVDTRIACNAHTEFNPWCSECTRLTNKAKEQQDAVNRAKKKNLTIGCDYHNEYRADCDACNNLTEKAHQQAESQLRGDHKNTTIPCELHGKNGYRADCDACNKLTMLANKSNNKAFQMGCSRHRNNPYDHCSRCRQMRNMANAQR